MKATYKPKILHLIKLSPPSKGGMETYVHDILKVLRNKFQIFVISDCSVKEEYSKGSIFIEGIEYFKLKTWGYIKNQPLSFSIRKLFKEFQKNDIVHLHYPYPTIELIVFICFLTLKKTPRLIITYHANPKKTKWSAMYTLFYPVNQYLFTKCEKVIFTSEHLMENSYTPGLCEEKKIVIPIGIPIDLNFTIDKVPMKKDPVILFVGKLRVYKGIEYLIEAMKDVNYGTCIIVGEGEQEDKLKKMIKTFDLEKKIKLKGEVSDNELIRLYKKAKVFVLPSINESEAFGIVQLEAMKYGVPVINTRLNSGVPFVSLDKITGITVSPKNAEDLTNAINQILGLNEVDYQQLCKNALSRAKEFNIESLAERIGNLYLKKNNQ